MSCLSQAANGNHDARFVFHCPEKANARPEETLCRFIIALVTRHLAYIVEYPGDVDLISQLAIYSQIFLQQGAGRGVITLYEFHYRYSAEGLGDQRLVAQLPGRDQCSLCPGL